MAQEFKNAPANETAFNRLGHAAAVCSGIIIVGTVIGVITETLPLQSMANAAIGQYIAPFLGERVTFFTVAVAVAAFVIYLAKENISAAKAVFSTFNADVKKEITLAGVALLWFILLFVIGTRFALTWVGSHQIAYMAIKPPELNTDAIVANDTLYSIQRREASEQYEKQRLQVIADNKQALNAAKKLAIASEATALQAVKNAPNEYRRNIATQKLKEVRAVNAERLAVVNAQNSQALQALSIQRNNVTGVTDSLNNVAKGLVIAGDAQAQNRYFWLSNKLTTFLPYISLFCVFLVTIAVFVLCLIQRAAGITVRFEQGKYENLPGLLTVYYKALTDIWQSRHRQFVAWLHSIAEKDIFAGNTVAAAAIGAGNTVQVSGSGSVQKVSIAPAGNVITPAITPQAQITPPEQQTEVEPMQGKVITLAKAHAQLNAYKSYLAKGERNPETCRARIKYFNSLIDYMKGSGIYEMVMPPFVLKEWL